MFEYTAQEISHLAQPIHPRCTEIICTGHYDLTKLYGHCWVPPGMDPGIPASPHDSAGRRAKISQTASDKVPRGNECILGIRCLPGSPFPTKITSLRAQMESNTHRTVKFYMGWPKTLRPSTALNCPKDSSGELTKCTLMSSAPRVCRLGMDLGI